MRRREFITLIGGAAVVWPLGARAQQTDRMRRIGVLATFTESDPESQSWINALVQRLQEIGWTDGRNLHIYYRWAAAERSRSRKN